MITVRFSKVTVYSLGHDARILQLLLKLPLLVQSSDGVAASDVLALDEDIRNRSLARQFSQRVLHLRSGLHAVELDCVEAHIHGFQQILRPRAITAGRFRENNERRRLDDALHISHEVRHGAPSSSFSYLASADSCVGQSRLCSK